MGNKTQRKKRYQRRRAHAVLTKGRPGLVAATYGTVFVGEPKPKDGKEVIAVPNTSVDRLSQTHAFSSIPTRAKCPVCGFSHKVKRDGTMGRHDVYVGDDKHQCDGTGRKFNE